MKKSLLSICAAAAMACCLCTVFAMPASAAPTEVVGDAPGSETAGASSEGSSSSVQKPTESAGLVPALPVETKPPQTEAPETEAPSASQETPKQEAPKQEAPKQETSAAPAAVVNEAPKEETTASSAPSAETKSTYAAEAPKPDSAAETEKPDSAAGTQKPDSPAQTDPSPAQEQQGRQTPAVGDPKPNSYETLTDEELEALDRVTGPGVAKVQGGSSYGVNEPTVIKTSGAAPATDWSRVSDTRKRIVDLAKTFIGGTYVYGGDSPEEGFDCSGLILYVYKEAAGIDLYHQSAVQASKGRAVSVTEMQPGDIIAYDGSPKDGIVNHVSIYAGDGKAIHAVGTGKGIRMTAFDYAAPLTIRNLLD